MRLQTPTVVRFSSKTSQLLTTPPSRLLNRFRWPSDGRNSTARSNSRALRLGCSAANARGLKTVMGAWTPRAERVPMTSQIPASVCRMESRLKWNFHKKYLETTPASLSLKKAKTSLMSKSTNTRITTMKMESKLTCSRMTENRSTTTWNHLEETKAKGKNEMSTALVTGEVMLGVSCSGEVSCGFSCLLAFFACSSQGGNADEALLLINCPTSSAFARFFFCR